MESDREGALVTAYTNQTLDRLRARGLGWTPKFGFDLWHFIRFGRAACELPGDDTECGHGVGIEKAG